MKFEVSVFFLELSFSVVSVKMSVHFSVDLSEVFEFDSSDGLEDDVFEMNPIPSCSTQRTSRKSGCSRFEN